MLWEQLEMLDWDVPIIFAGNWNVTNDEIEGVEWRVWVNKHEAKDISECKGCEDLQNPTWNNRHTTTGYVARRLARFFISKYAAWMHSQMQGNILYNHTVSNHSPIKICFKCKISRTVNRAPRPFKFNLSFLKDKTFCENMSEAWMQETIGCTDPQ